MTDKSHGKSTAEALVAMLGNKTKFANFCSLVASLPPLGPESEVSGRQFIQRATCHFRTKAAMCLAKMPKPSVGKGVLVWVIVDEMVVPAKWCLGCNMFKPAVPEYFDPYVGDPAMTLNEWLTSVDPGRHRFHHYCLQCCARKPVFGRKIVSKELKKEIFAEQGRLCNHCKTIPHGSFDLDHILPVSAGGTNDRHNLQVLCMPCHKSKSGKEAGMRTLHGKYRGANWDEYVIEMQLNHPNAMQTAYVEAKRRLTKKHRELGAYLMRTETILRDALDTLQELRTEMAETPFEKWPGLHSKVNDHKLKLIRSNGNIGP